MNLPEDENVNTTLIAGKDYPRTYREFVTMFPNNKSCTYFLNKLRWGDGFICPKCGVSSTFAVIQEKTGLSNPFKKRILSTRKPK